MSRREKITQRYNANGLSLKQNTRIAVVSNKPDTVSKKVFHILKREYKAFYASLNPQYDEELLIDISNPKAAEGFFYYYRIDVMILCSSFLDNAESDNYKEAYSLINLCALNEIKPVFLYEKIRVASIGAGESRIVGVDDAYNRICEEISNKVLGVANGLVIKCSITYGFDIKASNCDSVEAFFLDRIFSFDNSKYVAQMDPMLIDEVSEFVSDCIDKVGCINVTDEQGILSGNKCSFTDMKKGADIVSKQKGCVFNLIYQLMPGEYFGGERVAKVRIALGERLASRIPDGVKKQVDYIIPVPKTGLFYAMGLSKKLQIPYMQGLLKENTDERSFQMLDVNVRKEFLKSKISFISELLKEKSVILVDEAIFTGTTLKMVCKMLWGAGVKRIFLGIPTPPCYVTCGYYVQPERKMLLEYVREDMLTEYFDVDAVYFQTVIDFMSEIPNVKGLCAECFTRR